MEGPPSPPARGRPAYLRCRARTDPAVATSGYRSESASCAGTRFCLARTSRRSYGTPDGKSRKAAPAGRRTRDRKASYALLKAVNGLSVERFCSRNAIVASSTFGRSHARTSQLTSGCFSRAVSMPAMGPMPLKRSTTCSKRRRSGSSACSGRDERAIDVPLEQVDAASQLRASIPGQQGLVAAHAAAFAAGQHNTQAIRFCCCGHGKSISRM